MQQQHPEVTLSKMLNFLEGLWSSCSDERIIVFTTNHKERLDPALLCLGPMDVHVLTSYCPPCRQLASNYLNLTDHILFGDIEDLLKTAEEEKKENEELKAKMNIQIKKVKTNKKIEEKSDEKVMFKEIDDPIRSTKVTTAEMVEQLVKHQGKPTDAFMDLIEILKAKKRQSEDFAAAGRLKRIKLK
ncbi:hypothetical protein CDL15_Pgr020744 [Punica granatum]|uniref:ATPase AAA-type core domain-containing protein n=1 Tax=Punica granatum TaxID=22663 RepID=A0A218XVA7_PUNGR|nr:hypothetical protein CDL15_Pgr020744 [Punica granatum]